MLYSAARKAFLHKALSDTDDLAGQAGMLFDALDAVGQVCEILFESEGDYREAIVSFSLYFPVMYHLLAVDDGYADYCRTGDLISIQAAMTIEFDDWSDPCGVISLYVGFA